MATARKLPSGNWRVLCYDGMVDGKRHYASVTAATKKEAELKAAQYMADVDARQSISSITVKDALERYITAKNDVLSPSTIRGYRQIQKNHFDSIKDKDVYKLTTEDMQKFVSALAKKRSAKTVANSYGLLLSSVTMFRPDAVFRVTMPKKAKPQRHAPSDKDIATLFQAADPDMKLCIALAAFGSMRRGEICALKYEDVNGNIISVHADMVENENNKFEYKEIPKTSESVRTVLIPSQALDLIGHGEKDEFIVKRTPNAITHAFTRLRNEYAPGIRFHDLRHYFASIGAVLGVPDVYLSDFGGWRRGSGVMKEVYQGIMETESGRYAGIMADHFDKVMQHEMQHEK